MRKVNPVPVTPETPFLVMIFVFLFTIFLVSCLLFKVDELKLFVKDLETTVFTTGNMNRKSLIVVF